jgi:internalin A
VATGLPEANRRIDQALAEGATTLDLSGLHLTAVPERVADLPGLTELNLGGNPLTPPAWLADLTTLRDLDLGALRLREVPTWLRDLPGLRALHLHDNLVRTLPDWLPELPLDNLRVSGNRLRALPRFTGLTRLSISDNHLDGVPGWIAELTSLTELRLGGCRLAEVPAWLPGLTQLTRLDLDDNRLTNLPDALTDLPLTELRISDNRFTNLPDRLATLAGLTVLTIDGNALRGVPDWVGGLTALTRLDIASCRLTEFPEVLRGLRGLTRLELDTNRLSSLPDWLGEYTGLRYLRMNNNRLAELPRSLADLRDLEYLNLSGNHLIGVPDWLGELTGLRRLNLSGCRLFDVPEWLSHCTNLTDLGLSDNHVSELPGHLAALTELTTLEVGGNQLTELPDWLGHADLTELDVSGNRLTEVPGWLRGCTELDRLNLGGNRLTGLPDWLGELTRLGSATLSGCGLAAVPGWLADLPALTKLDLSDNQLTELPDWLTERPDLSTLCLGRNALSTVPAALSRLTGLRNLILSSNGLTALPEALGELTELQLLWIDHNPFTGVPDWIGGLRGLANLNISGCGLGGALPTWLPELRELTQLGIMANELTELPRELISLTGLEYLGLDHNQLSELPGWLTELPALRWLLAGHNRLRKLPAGLELEWLRLSGNELTGLPAGLSGLTWLELNGCGLTEIPDCVFEMTQLSLLEIDDNEISRWPVRLGELTVLTHLSLSGNPMGEIGPELGWLSKLDTLVVDECGLMELPPELAELMLLKRLDAGKNQLTELPPEIGALHRLRVLSVEENELTALPAELGRLTRLTALCAFGNRLTALPAELAGLPRLAELAVGGNRLTELPDLSGLPGLTELMLHDNRLTRLPDWLVDLPLTRLTTADNPLFSPPPEIAAGGADAVLDFLRDRRQDSSAQWVSKLLVVGEGGVGKTSLVKALAGDAHDPDEPSTHGLRIRDLDLGHPERADVTMRLSSWDFGGQQIYHATHQFFLTNRSLFLLLWNSRHGWEQGKLRRWLDIISARAPESPIVLVATHLGGRPVDLPLAELRAQYPRIVAGVRVDNATGEGVGELRELVGTLSAGLPLMGSEWPTRWLAAADAVRALPEDHTTPARMRQVLAGAGVTDPRQQRFVARALHELGDILYYAEDPELNQLVVLRPAWVNDYISRVLDSAEVADRQGLLTREHLDVLWADLDRGVRDHFLGMMDAYDLSYRVDDARSGDLSLVVERLQWDPPDYTAEWAALADRPDTKEIKVVYRLNTMPPGIPTWFIARSHRFSKGVHWRTGVLLGHPDTRHLALVRADAHRGTVELTVRGPQPVGFFMLLDDGLNLTLDRFPGLRIERKVPCRCQDGCPQLYDYTNLTDRLARATPRYAIECHDSGEDVSVPELLYGLSPSGDSTRAGLDKIVSLLERLEDKADGQAAYAQRMFLRVQRQLQLQQEARCPSVFAVVRADRRRLTGSAHEIHLYCEEPGAWHRLPGDRGVYPVTQPHEWFAKLGPYLRHLITALKHAAPLAGPVLGVAVGVLDAQLKADLDLMKELASQLPGELPGGTRLDSLGGSAAGPDAHAGTDADFRALRAMLRKLDPDETWGGLSRYTTPEGITLYLCPDHLAGYQPRH